MREVITALITANLAAGVGIVLVLLLRQPVRAGFGARVAYGLWVLVPLFAAASLAPPRSAELLPAPPIAPAAVVGAAEQALALAWNAGPAQAAALAPGGVSPDALAAWLWLAGALAMTVWLAGRQLQFAKAQRRGEAGPAVVGVLRPRIVLPSNFEERFERRERAVVLTHETIHLRRHDTRLNAAVALARCICWFNPLVHLGAHLMRLDQEMACDAAVVERHPRAKGAYALALVKAQFMARPLPLGCHWPPEAEHPLMQRIAMLKAAEPSAARRLGGGVLIAALSAAGGYAAWAAAPAVAPAAAAPYAYIEETLAPNPAPAALEQKPAPKRNAVLPRHRAAPQADPADTIRITGTIIRFDLRGPDRAIWVYGRARRPDGADLGAQLWRLEGIAPQTPAAVSASADATVNARGYGPLDKIAQSGSAPDCGAGQGRDAGCPQADKPSSIPTPPSEAEIRAVLAGAPGEVAYSRFVTDAVMRKGD